MNEPSSLVKDLQLRRSHHHHHRRRRARSTTPAWNDVIGLRVPFSTTRPVTRPPAGSSMTTSRAGAVTLRCSWMKSVFLAQHHAHAAGREAAERERAVGTGDGGGVRAAEAVDVHVLDAHAAARHAAADLDRRLERRLDGRRAGES